MSYHVAGEQHPHGGDWLREIVFGLNDGLVTTLVFVMAAGTIAHSHLLLVVLSEVAAGGVSMALGGYLSAQTERDVQNQRVATERQEIQHEPEEERAELRAIYHGKGLRGGLLERVVSHLTANEERWLRALEQDELGLVEDKRVCPLFQGLQIGFSFVIGGLIPSLPLILRLSYPRGWAYGLTALTAVLLGVAKSRYTLKGPVRAGLEFLVIVTLGTLAGVMIGLALHAA